MTRTAHASATAAAVGPYSHAAEINGIVYLSGQTPLKPGTTELVQGDITAQAGQIFENLNGVLAAAGLSSQDVIKCNVYLTDMGDFAAMNAVYTENFSAPYPARTTIGVASLPLGAQIEIEMVAIRPTGRLAATDR